MPKYIYKVSTERVLMPTTGEIRFGTTIITAATISGKLTATKATTVAAVTGADASAAYDAATQATITELKTKLNAALAALKAANLMA